MWKPFTLLKYLTNLSSCMGWPDVHIEVLYGHLSVINEVLEGKVNVHIYE
jgi:hypothetical protein